MWNRFLHSRIMLLRQAMVELAIKSSRAQAHSEPPSLQQTLEAGIVEACASSAEELIQIIHPSLGTLLVPPACYTVSCTTSPPTQWRTLTNVWQWFTLPELSLQSFSVHPCLAITKILSKDNIWIFPGICASNLYYTTKRLEFHLHRNAYPTFKRCT
jgi:hypothetical protein